MRVIMMYFVCTDAQRHVRHAHLPDLALPMLALFRHLRGCVEECGPGAHALSIAVILAAPQGMRFESVRALVHTHGDPPDLELGAYAAGLLASDLFRDCTLVLDYPARRFAAVPFADKD